MPSSPKATITKTSPSNVAKVKLAPVAKGGGIANYATVTNSKAPVTKGGGIAAYQTGTPLAGNTNQTLLNAFLASLPQPGQTPGENANLGGVGGGRGGGGGGRGGGGGAAGPTPAQIRAAADQTFQFNAAPYDLMRQQVGNQRTQAQGYNPDFAGMQNTYNQGLQNIDQARAQAVAQRLQQLVGFGQQLAGTQTGAMQGALRDLSAQGVAPGRYLDQSNQIAGDRTAMLANQGQYMGQLNASAANQLAGDQAAGGLIRQGGEATLANNRGTLMNSLAQQDAQIGLQQAQAQQANDQARREFMLKYGVL